MVATDIENGFYPVAVASAFFYFLIEVCVSGSSGAQKERAFLVFKGGTWIFFVVVVAIQVIWFLICRKVLHLE